MVEAISGNELKELPIKLWERWVHR